MADTTVFGGNLVMLGSVLPKILGYSEGHDLLGYEYKLKTNFLLITFIELSIACNHFQNI